MNKVKFKGKIKNQTDIIYYIYKMGYFDRNNTIMFLNDIFRNNIIIPLEKNESCDTHRIKDNNGMRILDFKIIKNRQVGEYMKINGYYNSTIIPHMGEMNARFDTSLRGAPSMYNIEEYQQLLNVTYLVDDEKLMEWFNFKPNIKNIGNKRVEDCSIEELFFAIKHKLN
ncbi:MAG: hypothetical protein EOL97_12880 [Spirochaetia bacterium]|nr:hypothetical protein [Spirochaetia bacterium]